jgi:Adenylate cyclase regulatory domain
MTDDDALTAQGMYDPAAPDAAERLALLHWLLGLGVTLEQIVAADERGSVYRAGIESLLWPERGALTIAQVAEAAGLPVSTVRRARRLLGLADPGDEPACHTEEIELLRTLGGAIALFGEENALQFARVLGTATAAMAEAAIATFASSVARPMHEAGATQLQYAQRVREATAGFGAARRAIDIAMRLQFAEALDRLTLGWGGPAQAPGDEIDFTIGFVDLADSTWLTLESGANDFAAAVRDFEEVAAESAAGFGARLVKLIGDSAMLAAPHRRVRRGRRPRCGRRHLGRPPISRRARWSRVRHGRRAWWRLLRSAGEPRGPAHRDRRTGSGLERRDDGGVAPEPRRTVGHACIARDEHSAPGVPRGRHARVNLRAPIVGRPQVTVN